MSIRRQFRTRHMYQRGSYMTSLTSWANLVCYLPEVTNHRTRGCHRYCCQERPPAPVIQPSPSGMQDARRCDTQSDYRLWITAKKKTVDIILLDFSKASDKVPHQRLLHKLDFYGVRGTSWLWIKDFADNKDASCQSGLDIFQLCRRHPRDSTGNSVRAALVPHLHQHQAPFD